MGNSINSKNNSYDLLDPKEDKHDENKYDENKKVEHSKKELDIMNQSIKNEITFGIIDQNLKNEITTSIIKNDQNIIKKCPENLKITECKELKQKLYYMSHTYPIYSLNSEEAYDYGVRIVMTENNIEFVAILYERENALIYRILRDIMSGKYSNYKINNSNHIFKIYYMCHQTMMKYKIQLKTYFYIHQNLQKMIGYKIINKYNNDPIINITTQEYNYKPDGTPNKLGSIKEYYSSFKLENSMDLKVLGSILNDIVKGKFKNLKVNYSIKDHLYFEISYKIYDGIEKLNLHLMCTNDSFFDKFSRNYVF